MAIIHLPAWHKLNAPDCAHASFRQVQETRSAEAVAREIASLVERLRAADKITAVSDATKDLHTAISKLEKARPQQRMLALLMLPLVDLWY